MTDDFASRWPNLADSRLGAVALHASDAWFAPAERMLQPTPAEFHAGRYDDHGKWMDGWETRRKRTTGHDHCIVRLAGCGHVRGVDIDTSHFTGNFPPSASIEACRIDGDPDGATGWHEILPPVPLTGDSHHFHGVQHDGPWTHVRLNIYPDGGVARLRVYGSFARDWQGGRRGRPRRHREWWLAGGLQRPALRLARQHSLSRDRRHHGRGLGNQPAAGARQRMGALPSRLSRCRLAGRGRHHPFQGQLPGPLFHPGGPARSRRFVRGGLIPLLEGPSRGTETRHGPGPRLRKRGWRTSGLSATCAST